MARSNRSIQVARLYGSHPRRQLASVYKTVYFGVETITPPPSKPAVVFSLNEGDNKITLPDVVNSKILDYAHWSDIFTLRSLSDNQKREIDGNKSLVFNLTMQRLEEIINSSPAMGAHERPHFEKLLWGLVSSTIFVRW
jgi:hypothetical protein